MDEDTNIFTAIVGGTLVALAIIGGIAVNVWHSDETTTQQRVACLAAGGEWTYSDCVLRD